MFIRDNHKTLRNHLFFGGYKFKYRLKICIHINVVSALSDVLLHKYKDSRRSWKYFGLFLSPFTAGTYKQRRAIKPWVF